MRRVACVFLGKCGAEELLAPHLGAEDRANQDEDEEDGVVQGHAGDDLEHVFSRRGGVACLGTGREEEEEKT